MATDPKVPVDREIPRDDHAKVVLTRKPSAFWPWLVLAATVAILIALIVWLPRTPKQPAPPSAAQVPPQPTGTQVQLTQLKTSVPTGSGATDLTGNIFNNGATSIMGVTVKATFRNMHGQALETESEQMQEVDPSNGQPITLAADPIPPGSTRPFKIRFERVPEGWNRNVPDLQIIQVRAAGNK